MGPPVPVPTSNYHGIEKSEDPFCSAPDLQKWVDLTFLSQSKQAFQLGPTEWITTMDNS